MKGLVAVASTKILDLAKEDGAGLSVTFARFDLADLLGVLGPPRTAAATRGSPRSLRSRKCRVQLPGSSGRPWWRCLRRSPWVLAPEQYETETVAYVLVDLLGVVGVGVGRSSGRWWLHSGLYGSGVVVAARAVMVVKNVLAGH